jgi:hypothetical protein
MISSQSKFIEQQDVLHFSAAPRTYLRTNSTRRIYALPSGVLLVPIGFDLPI